MQRELLQAVINKSLYALFIEQQQQLAYIGYPKFSFGFTEQLQDIIEKRKAAVSTSGSGSGSGSIVSRDSIFGNDPVVTDTIISQRNMVCALLSVRLMMVSAEMSRQQRVKREQSYTDVTGSAVAGADSGLSLKPPAADGGAAANTLANASNSAKRKRRRTLSGIDTSGSGYSSGDLTPGIEQQINEEGDALLAPILNAYSSPLSEQQQQQQHDQQKQMLLQQVANMMRK